MSIKPMDEGKEISNITILENKYFQNVKCKLCNKIQLHSPHSHVGV